MDIDEVTKPKVIRKDNDFLIPFTQYLLPNGRQKPIQHICHDVNVADKAQQILDAGFRFDIEVLRNGIVSATIGGQLCYEEGDDPEDGDVAHVIAPNGPPLVEKIDRMILDFQIPEDGIVKRY